MARLVACVGVPHSPTYPRQVQQEGGDSLVASRFREVAERLDAARPDVLVVFTADHLWRFFYDNLPAFCVGIEDQAEGPEPTVAMPRYQVKIHRSFAEGLLKAGLDAEFDLASAEEFELDHSTMVPLHFLRPQMDIPVVPVFVRGLIPPLPRAARCYALGRMLRDYIQGWDSDKRVAAIASGDFSNEVGGPRMGQRNSEWTREVLGHVVRNEATALIEKATTERMLAAGNVSGELLNWIALLGAIGDSAGAGPGYVQEHTGNAFVFWATEAA